MQPLPVNVGETLQKQFKTPRFSSRMAKENEACIVSVLAHMIKYSKNSKVFNVLFIFIVAICYDDENSIRRLSILAKDFPFPSQVSISIPTFRFHPRQDSTRLQ